ncbi:MAG TPA: hypothetical protein VML56_03605 [Burkholderiales bacterium]|nr:hypothetical protein [Burkholderiales bacterium]
MLNDQELRERELRRAGDARQILDAPLFQEAKRDIEDQLRELRRVVPIRDTEMHTRLILMEQLWRNLLGHFEQLAETGRMADLQLEEKRRQQNLIERGIAMFRTGGRNAV